MDVQRSLSDIYNKCDLAHDTRSQTQLGAQEALQRAHRVRNSRVMYVQNLSPGCRSVGLCRALSGLCRGSVGTLSGLCRLTTVGPLSASVGLCRPILTVTTRVPCRPLSVCRDSVGLSVCRPLSVSVDELSGSVEGSQRPLRVKLTSPFNPKAPF